MVKKFTSVTLCAIVCVTILIFCFMFRLPICGIELKNGDTMFKANMECAVQNVPGNNI